MARHGQPHGCQLLLAVGPQHIHDAGDVLRRGLGICVFDQGLGWDSKVWEGETDVAKQKKLA